MIVLQASHIEKQFDGNIVLKDATFTVQSRDRTALIGLNGAGKSTLLRICIGELEKDGGTISFGKGVTVGYISQFVEVANTITVYQYVANVFAHVYELEQKLRKLEQLMASRAVYENPAKLSEVAEEYAASAHQFEELGGYGIDARVRRVLDGLGFGKAMHHMSVVQLSGGQKTRLSLARLLAAEPSLLVLDEPTNYLDTDTLTWLETYLQGYEGALLVVSHDRYFLDQIATQMIELEHGYTTAYIGNYSNYVEEKAERAEAVEKRFEAQQKEITKIEDFIQRNIVRSSTTKRAQSRRKMLSKMSRIEQPGGDALQMALRFHATRSSGKDVLITEQLSIGYDKLRLAETINLRVTRGERLAIVGPNGTGKTTLLKTLQGHLPALHGQTKWGQYVSLGYYDQEQSNLSSQKTVLNQIWDEHPSFDRTTIRSALARFLFRGEDIDKPVSALSGGERSRLSLCRLMLDETNTLLLDEPTNHLDMHSVDLLIEALNKYEGSYILVSHDRYFVNKTANKIWEIENYKIKEFVGTYDEWERWKQERKSGEKNMEEKKEVVKKTAVIGKKNRNETFESREQQKELQKVKRQFEQLEEQIAKNTVEKKQLEANLALPEIYSDREKFIEAEKKYNQKLQELSNNNAEYEKLFEKMILMEEQIT